MDIPLAFVEIVGKQALFVVNLEPRKMMGELSQGMLFDLGFKDGIVSALALPDTPLPNGVRAGQRLPPAGSIVPAGGCLSFGGRV